MDDYSGIFGFIGILIGGFILYAITRVVVRMPGTVLRGKFQKLGTLKGRSIDEIIAVAGPPNSRSAARDGRVVCQWIATGYHIALIFSGDVCDGVTHEYHT